MNGTRIHPAQVTPAMLAMMSPADRQRYAPAGALATAAAAMLTSDGGSPTQADTRAEKLIQDDICRWLRDQGYQFLVQRMDRPSSGSRGWPDVTLAAKCGRAVAFEVKNARGRLSPWQRERVRGMQRVGWIVEVVRSLRHAQDFLRAVEAAHKA